MPPTLLQTNIKARAAVGRAMDMKCLTQLYGNYYDRITGLTSRVKTHLCDWCVVRSYCPFVYRQWMPVHAALEA